MRHQNKTVKLGRSQAHRDALLANQVCSLIIHQRIRTTLAKAKATRPLAEKMVTLGKKGTIHARRTAAAYLHQDAVVKKLFEDIAPRSASRPGGYTRIIKLGPRKSDSAPMAILEWVDAAVVETAAEPAAEAKPKAAKAAKKPASEKKPAAKKKAAPKKEDDKAE
jgi:large subunit ribosomal protein L17